MDELIRKHVRTLPVEVVAAAIWSGAPFGPPGPGSTYSYCYEEKESGYWVRIEVFKPMERRANER